MCNLICFTIPKEEFFKEEKNRIVWKQIVDHGEESLDEEDRRAGRGRYSSAKELLLDYMENDSGLVWCAKQRTKIDV